MQVGDTLDGKYRLMRQLRSGGMGTVYVAERVALGDQVAVKIILPSQNNDVARARFLREAQAAARIRHPNVVQIFDFGEAGPQTPYFVMEFLDGPTLDDEIRAHKAFSVERTLEVFRPICAAVEAGHRRGVLHRDLKPGNVMLCRMDDGREVVKVLDFGLARFTGEDGGEKLTVSGAMVGTYSYMSPEQILSEEISPATDVFSLGIILYELVTGRLPFNGGSSFAVMDRIVAGRYKPAIDLVPDLHAGIARAISAALLVDPKKRPQTPAELMGLVDGNAPIRLDATMVEPDPSTEPRHKTHVVAGPTTNPRDADSDGFSVAGDSEWPEMNCFVCRDAEMETLKSEYQNALAGNGRLTIIAGDAGIGKSTLVRAFGDWARERGALVVTGRFFDYEGNRPAPFQTFVAMLASANNPSLQSHVTSGDLRADERIGQLVAGGFSRDEGGIHDENDKWRVFAAITEEFQRLASERPLVLVFDDVQWASRMNLELLGYLGRNLAGRRTLVVGTARDTDTQRNSGSDLASWLLGQGNLRTCAVLPIKPFSVSGVRTWLESVFDRIRIRQLDVQRLEDATGGNPYYLYEMTRNLVSAGQIARRPGGWECADLDRVSLPETVSNAVRAQLRGVDERLRSVVETAAVIGDQFRFDTLLEATGLEELDLESMLELAEAQQIISEEGVQRPDDYRFYSATIRRVLYEDLPTRRRRRLHQRVVRALEDVYADRLDRIARALSYHNHAVGSWREALRWGVRAGEEAIARADTDAAEVVLGRAREAAEALRAEGTEPPESDILRLDLLTGSLLLRAGRPTEAKTALASAVAVARASGEATMHAEALLEIAQCHVARGKLDRAVEVAEEAARIAGAAGDRPRAFAARITAANVLRRLGRTVEAEERFEAIHAILTGSDPASLRSLVAQNLAWICTLRGAFEEGGELARQALALARESRDPIAEQQACSVMALWYDETGDHESAIRWHEDSLRLSRSLSLRRREGIDLANIGETYYRLGQFERARSTFEESLTTFVEIGDRACEGDCRVNLGRALLACGELDGAVTMLTAGLRLCEETGRREYAALALLYIGEVNLAAGAIVEAELALKRSREIYADLGWRDVAQVDEALARLEMKKGGAAD